MTSKNVTEDPYFEEVFGIKECMTFNNGMKLDTTYNKVYTISPDGWTAEIKKSTIEQIDQYFVVSKLPDYQNREMSFQ